MHVKGADRLTKAGPNAVIVHASGHDDNQHLMAVGLRTCHDFLLKGLLWFTVTLTADGPCMHFSRDVAKGRHFTNLIQIFLRGVVGCLVGRLVKGHLSLHHIGPLYCRTAESAASLTGYRMKG
jgi:hypothetical protein